MDIFEKLRQKKMELAASETQATDNQTAFQAAKPPAPPAVQKLSLPGVSTIKAPPERVPEPVKMNMGNLDAVPESYDLSEEDQDALLDSLDMTMDLGDDDDDDGDEDYEVAEQDGIKPPAPEPVRPQVTGLSLKPLSLVPARAAGIGHPGPTPEPTLAPARVADNPAPAASEPAEPAPPLEPVPEPAPEPEPPAKPRVLGLSLPVKPSAGAPEAKPGLSLPAGSMLARMQARGQEQKAAETAGLEAFNVGGLSAPRPGLSPAGAIAAAAAAPRSYSPEEYRDDWEALPELVDEADEQDREEYNRERMLLIAKASHRIQEIFGGELQGLAVTAASEMSIAEVSQLVKLTFIRVKAAPGAWAMLDLQDKARVIAGMKAMAIKRNSSVKSRKPKDAAALSGSLETMGSSLSDEDLADLDSSGFTMAFGDFGQ